MSCSPFHLRMDSFILAGCQNSWDIFLREGRGVYSNARLQAFSSRSGVYLSANFSRPMQDL